MGYSIFVLEFVLFGLYSFEIFESYRVGVSSQDGVSEKVGLVLAPIVFGATDLFKVATGWPSSFRLEQYLSGF